MKQKDPIIEYLALFNQIDKHFDKILNLDGFVPYNDKIKRIVEGKYPISWFVGLHKYQLKFFGELRNHITHGIKLDGHLYATPSQYAIDQIRKTANAIKSPPTCFEVFKKDVFSCKESDLLKNILNNMKINAYTHVPVYDEKNRFKGVLTERDICYRLADKIQNNHISSLDNIKIGHININKILTNFMFVNKNINIYEIDEMFTTKKKLKQRLGAIFITNHGLNSEKILGIITSGDVALVDTYIVH